jgi:hypothetical protein
MGIRFFCPNGHRLHVKGFLAGKRGVCPDCGQRVNIPLESDARAIAAKKNAANSGTATDHPVSTAVLDGPETVIAMAAEASSPQLPAHGDFALPAELELPSANRSAMAAAMAPVQPVAVASAPVASAPVGSAPVPQSAPVEVPPPPSIPKGAAVVGPVDPIDELPNAVWYVRPPAGGQYGPAKGEVFRKWMGEGRVTAESLVWREDWADWRSAGKVFSSLGASAAPAVEPTPVVSESPRRSVRPQRKDSKINGVGIVVTLGLVCVGLFVALLYVLMSSGAQTATP